MSSGQHDSAHNLPADLNPTQHPHSLLDPYARDPLELEQQILDARKLCILGLPWDTSDEELRDYFSTFGPLENASIIRKARTGESRGFGFVTYRAASDAQTVLIQEHSIGGRHIDAKQALPRGSANPNRETRLFIGKLPVELSDLELREHFEKFGKVQDAYIPKDASNGKQGHRGFGFVTFANADDVDKVLQCAHTIKDCDVAVQCAVPKDKTLDVQSSRINPKTWPFPLSESYTSSNDSLTTIGVASQALHGSIGSHIPHHPGSRLAGGAMKSRLDPEYNRPFGRASLDPSNQASTSGRDYGYPGSHMAGHGAMEHSHLDRFGSDPATTSRNSLDHGQRHRNHNVYSPDSSAAVQALQGLTLGGGPGEQNGLGISLALLQQQQNAKLDASRQAFPSQSFPSQQPGVTSGYAPRAGFNNPRLGGPAKSTFPNPNFQGASNLYSMQPASHGSLTGGFNPRPAPVGQAPAGPIGGLAGMTGPPDARAGPRMFVGKLNKDINEQDIKDYMTQFGYVLDVYMPRDKLRRTEHRGFGFVTFETAAAIERVALNGPHRIKGCAIVVDEAAPRREESADGLTDLSDSVPPTPAYPSQMPSSSLSTSANPTQGHGLGGGMGVLSSSPMGTHYLNGMPSPGSASHGTPRLNTRTTSSGQEQQQHHQYMPPQSGLTSLSDYGQDYSTNEGQPTRNSFSSF